MIFYNPSRNANHEPCMGIFTRKLWRCRQWREKTVQISTEEKTRWKIVEKILSLQN